MVLLSYVDIIKVQSLKKIDRQTQKMQGKRGWKIHKSEAQ